MEREVIKSYINRDMGLIVIENDISDLVSDYLDYYIQNGVETIPGEAMEDLKVLIALSTSFSTFMEKNSIYGWNIFYPESGLKLFSSVDMGDISFVARGIKYRPEKKEKNRLVLEKYISQSNRSSSAFELDKDESIYNMSRNFLNSLWQEKTEFFSNGNRFYFLKELPGCDNDYIDQVTEKIKNGKNFKNELSELNSFAFSFKCGCNKNKLKSMIDSLDSDSLDYLFSEGEPITTECPRCGKKYKFVKAEFGL